MNESIALQKSYSFREFRDSLKHSREFQKVSKTKSYEEVVLEFRYAHIYISWYYILYYSSLIILFSLHTICIILPIIWVL